MDAHQRALQASEIDDLATRISDACGLSNVIEWNAEHTLARVVSNGDEGELTPPENERDVIVEWSSPEILASHLRVTCALIGA